MGREKPELARGSTLEKVTMIFGREEPKNGETSGKNGERPAQEDRY